MQELEKETLHQLMVRGLNSIIFYNDQIVDLLCSKHLDILEDTLPFVDVSMQMKIVEKILNKNPSQLKESFWINFVNKALEIFKNETNKYVYDYGAWYVLLNRIKDQTSKIDWFEVLIRLSQATAEVGIKAPGFSTVLNWMIMADKNNLLALLYRTETKQYPGDLKIELYTKLVEFGLLDVKMARRVRSDSSGVLSYKVLQFLFINRSLYSIDDFQNLITQFSDTKHKLVARFMAINLPIDLVPFLMGVQDKMAIEILESRMNLLEN